MKGHDATDRRKRPFRTQLFRLQVTQRWYIIFTLCMIQGCWLLVDEIPSSVKPKPPRKRIIPIESSPLAPFYNATANPYQGPSRVFPIYEGDFCGPLVDLSDLGARTPTREGLFFIKEMKTGSTTLSGVTVRIARNVARRKYPTGATATTKIVNTSNSSLLKQQHACASRFVHMRARRLRDAW
jgi:hypothetical protein